MGITLTEYFEFKGMCHTTALFTGMRFRSWARWRRLFPAPLARRSKKLGHLYDPIALDVIWESYLQKQKTMGRNPVRLPR